MRRAAGGRPDAETKIITTTTESYRPASSPAIVELERRAEAARVAWMLAVHEGGDVWERRARREGFLAAQRELDAVLAAERRR